jgi:hypothetical protein
MTLQPNHISSLGDDANDVCVVRIRRAAHQAIRRYAFENETTISLATERAIAAFVAADKRAKTGN